MLHLLFYFVHSTSIKRIISYLYMFLHLFILMTRYCKSNHTIPHDAPPTRSPSRFAFRIFSSLLTRRYIRASTKPAWRINHSWFLMRVLKPATCWFVHTDLALLACSIERSIVSSIKLGTILVAFRSRHISAGTIRLLFCFLRTQVCMRRYLSKQARKQANDGTINHLIDCFLTCFVGRNDDSID